MNVATYDFGDDNGPVAAHQHANGGGWVADTAYVAAGAYVASDARVYDAAHVYGSARVSGSAHVYGSAHVSRPLTQIVRTDGYTFLWAPCEDGERRVIAGCRYFTMTEARQHWGPDHDHHAETAIILDTLERFAAL